jgi:hypothetical protein
MTNNSTEILFCNHPTTETGNMNQDHDTPRTDEESVNHIGFYSCATVPSSFARKLERELNASREAYLKSVERDDYLTQALAASQAEVERLRAILKDHATFLRKNRFEPQANLLDPTDTPRTDTPRTEVCPPLNTAVRLFPLSLELSEEWKVRAEKAEAEVEELQQQKRNCIEILDDDAKEKAELKAEVERLLAALKAWTTLD